MFMFEYALNGIKLSVVAVVDEVIVTGLAGEAQPLELRIGSEAVEEGVFVDGGIGAVVAVDRDLEHAQGGRGLAAIGEVSGEHVVHFGVVIDFYAAGKRLNF